MRVVEFQVADPTGAVADPLIAAASDVVKLPAGSGAMVHDDAIIPTVGSQLTTHAASVSVAVASEADLQATSGEEASGRHGSAATWQMRWSRQAIESGDATAASLGTRSVTGRVGGASWLSSGLVTPAAREVHAAIATPAAAAAADSSATVAPADSMTPWAQAFAAATTSTNDLLGSAGTALVGMDSLSATPAKWGTVSQAGLSGTELAGLAGVSGVAESAGLQGALAQGDGSAGSAASNDGSFDADVNADRIMRAMTTQLNGRAGGSIRLRLDPPGLGELRIDMSLTGDGVKVTLMPSNEASAQLLGGQLHQLREALQSRGFSIASLNVDHPQGVDSTGRGGQDRAADQFNGQQQGQQGGQGSQNQGRHQPSDSQSQGVQDNGTAPNAEAGGRGRGTALNAEAMVGGPRVSNLPEREREELNLIG
jgi:flagellar hook-length control protein FliK